MQPVHQLAVHAECLRHNIAWMKGFICQPCVDLHRCTCMSRSSTVPVLMSSWSASVDLPAWSSRRQGMQGAAVKVCQACTHRDRYAL